MIEGGGKAGGAGGVVAIVMASGFSRRMGTNKPVSYTHLVRSPLPRKLKIILAAFWRASRDPV